MSTSTPLLAAIPSLDDLVADPRRVALLPPEAAQTLLIGLASIQAILIQRALKGPDAQPAEHPERFLTVSEVAEQFGVSENWLYRHKRQLPHSQPSRKVLLFPEEKLRRWFSTRKTG